jgi:ribonuclease P protein subunit POP4
MFAGELIGKTIEVIDSTNIGDVKVKGKIIDETKYTIIVKQDNKTKTLMKRNITFTIDGKRVIQGRTIMKRPEERIKG